MYRESMIHPSHTEQLMKSGDSTVVFGYQDYRGDYSYCFSHYETSFIIAVAKSSVIHNFD